MDEVKRSEKEWKKRLTPGEYHVLREKGTETPFTGKYWNKHSNGVYRCAACNEVLFSSDDKFDSGTGWPSFTHPQSEKAVKLNNDTSHSMQRTEVACSKCGSHLGHVFDDEPGSPPAGKKGSAKRFCINSSALNLTSK